MSRTSKTPLRWPDAFDGYTTHDKQEAALVSDARYKVLEWGRRAGKNITAVIELIDYGRAPWRSRWGSDDPEQTSVWWVARSYDQAEKYGFLPMLSALPESWITNVSRSEPYEILLSNGVHYEFRTYDHPETLQGAGVDKMLVDEADYMKDSLWYDDLEPMLLDTTGAAVAISKPVRHGSWFQMLAERGRHSDYPNHYYSHATSADNPFIDEDPMDKQGTMPDAKFRQQYLAELPDDGGQVFSGLGSHLFTADYDILGELIDGVGEVSADPDAVTGPYSVGVDLARSRDYRVTLALDVSGQIAYYKRAQNESWDGIQSHIERIHAEFPGVVVPDASRDNKIISDLWHAGVELEPVKFSPQNKLQLIEDLITAVETGELSAPDTPALDQLRMEMRMLEKEVTRSGYTKYHAPNSGYDDSVDAFALAYRGLESAAGASSATASVGGRDYGDSDGDAIREAVDEYQRQYERMSGGNKWK